MGDDGYWFAAIEAPGIPSESTSVPSSAASNADLPSLEPVEYAPPDTALQSGLPFPVIRDTTEGVAAFSDLDLKLSTSGPFILVDIGAGQHDHVKHYLEDKYAGLECLPVDPFQRTRAHNEQARAITEAAGGADIVTSMSVLNILATKNLVRQHIELVHRILRLGGISYFKVWAGMWPERGTGVAQVDKERHVYQSNRWAATYRDSVAAVFGADNVFVDAERHLLVAIRR